MPKFPNVLLSNEMVHETIQSIFTMDHSHIHVAYKSFYNNLNGFIHMTPIEVKQLIS